jgi:glycosyltransferase involved in cell wall biosynthesis
MFFSEKKETILKCGDILFVGRLEEQKNLHTLILAAAQIPGIRLTFAGEGKLAPQLMQLAAAHSVQLNLLGRVNNTDLPALMAEHTLFVLPSLYEGHPKSLLEAMAAGMPVIGTAVPGITDSIEHGTTGLLCPPTPEGLREAIERLLENKEMRDKLGHSARLSAQDFLSLPRVASRELAALIAACSSDDTGADAYQ